MKSTQLLFSVLHNARLLNVYQLAKEQDVGQDTTNPFILCNRLLVSHNTVDLKALNSILAFNNISISKAEFNYLLSIKPISLPKFPFSPNDQSVISVIGSATNKGKEKPKNGVYLIETEDKNESYVGSSNNLAMRVRYYYSKKGLAENRLIAKTLVSKGLNKFNVSVYILDPNNVVNAGISTSLESLTLAFEQLIILQIKPTLNTLYVVNGTPSAHSSYKQVGKPVYVYDANKHNLLYLAESGTQMEKDIGITVHSINRNIQSGKPMYGKYVFTRTPILNATNSLIDANALREDLKWCYRHRADLRDYLKAAKNMTPIILVDLLDNNKSYYFISKRKSCLFTQNFPVERQVNQLDVVKFKLPFEYKGWLFKSNITSS